MSGKASVEKVASQDQVDVELEAGIIEDKVYTALLLAFCLGLLKQGKGFGKVVHEDVLFGGLSSLAALQLLNVLVGHVGKQRQVSRIAPQADLAHLGEQDLFSLGVMCNILISADLLDDVCVSGGELYDRVTRGSESVSLLAGKEIVALPVVCQGEEGVEASKGGISIEYSEYG
jgi:hypothetical protein